MKARAMETQTDFTYVGNEMAKAGDTDLYYDENGSLRTGLKDANTSVELEWNWDGKLSRGTVDQVTVEFKYDPAGNRIAKNSSIAGNRKYIVDVVGDLPTILLELNPVGMSIKKSYIYADSQILAERDGDYLSGQYFYLHDRLGSVRQVVNSEGNVVKMFTYSPFGETLEQNGDFYTPWQFTGQYLDSETGFYYLRARMYSPYLGRFASHDPVMGKFEEPMTLHKYMYCHNDPVNRWDPSGLFYTVPGAGKHYDEKETWQVMSAAIDMTSEWWNPVGWWNAFGFYNAAFDYSPYWKQGMTFTHNGQKMGMREFTNYNLGYCAYYNSPYIVDMMYVYTAYAFGNLAGNVNYLEYKLNYFDVTRYLFDEYKGTGSWETLTKRLPGDNITHTYLIVKGALDSNRENFHGGLAVLERFVLGTMAWGLNTMRWLEYVDSGLDYVP